MNLDKGVTDFFADSEYEVSYGVVVLFPALFQYDVSRFCLGPVSAQMGNDRMKVMAETKLLDYNQEKSFVAVIIDKRGGKVLKFIFEIRAIIDDCRSHVAGRISSGLDIWEMAVIPFLTSNCDTWYSISDHSDKSLQELDKLQNRFYRMLLNVPNGCQTPSLYWDLGGLLMKNRILKKSILTNIEKFSFSFSSLTSPSFFILSLTCTALLVIVSMINIRSVSKPV